MSAPEEKQSAEPPKEKPKPEAAAKPAKKGPKARTRLMFDLAQDKRTIRFKNQKCARCGATMAHHKAPVERWTCGACSYTDFTKKS